MPKFLETIMQILDKFSNFEKNVWKKILSKLSIGPLRGTRRKTFRNLMIICSKLRKKLIEISKKFEERRPKNYRHILGIRNFQKVL